MTPQLTLKEIADKAEGYADALRDADSLRFALRNMAMLLREHLAPSAPPAAETRPETVEETGARYLASLRRHGADEQLLAAATKAAQEVEDDIRKEHA